MSNNANDPEVGIVTLLGGKSKAFPGCECGESNEYYRVWCKIKLEAVRFKSKNKKGNLTSTNGKFYKNL